MPRPDVKLSYRGDLPLSLYSCTRAGRASPSAKLRDLYIQATPTPSFFCCARQRVVIQE